MSTLNQFALPVDVRGFGAQGDGVNDDSAKIQAACDFLAQYGGSQGSACYLPPGRYLLKNAVVVPDNVTISGAGDDTVILLGDDTATQSLTGFVVDVNDNASFQNFKVIGPSLPGIFTIHFVAKGAGGSISISGVNVVNETSATITVGTGATFIMQQYAEVSTDPYPAAAPKTLTFSPTSNIWVGEDWPRRMKGAVDPSAGGGVSAPEGSIYQRFVSAAGEAWLKIGVADTAWSRLQAGPAAGTTLQGAYSNGPPVDITLTNALGGIAIHDGSPVVAGSLFAVTNNGNTLSYLSVDTTTVGLREVTATANAVQDVVTVESQCSANAAAGFGVGILLRADDDASATKNSARIASVWIDPAAASLNSYVSFGVALNSAGVTLTEVARIGSPTAAAATGSIMLNSGTAALPAYSFISDTSIGAYLPAANTYGIATSGIQRVRITGTEFFYTQTATAAGTPDDVEFVFAAHTNVTASTEVLDLNVNNARTVTWNTGSFALERSVSIGQPTWAANGASTITRGVTVDISGAPNAGANVTITDLRGLSVGGTGTGTVTAGPSQAASSYAAITTPAHTITYTTTTAQTGEGSISNYRVNPITVAQNTGAGTLTIASAASIYVVNAPIAGTGTALTETFSILVGNGLNAMRFEDATTNTAINILTLRRTTSGTAAANLGGGFNYELEDDAGATRQAGRFYNSWLSAVAATCSSQFTWELRTNGGTFQTEMVLGRAQGLEIRGARLVLGSNAAQSVVMSTGSNVFTTAIANSNFGAKWTTQSGVSTVTGYWWLVGSRTNASTASTETLSFDWDASASIDHNTGALTTQRTGVYRQPTNGFAGASTITNAVAIEFVGAPIAGTNTTQTATSLIRLCSANVNIGATAAAMTYDVFNMLAHTVTVTGSTNVTSACGFAGIRLGQITVTDASAVTVSGAAAIYVADAPVGAGSVTLAASNTYAIFVDAGVSRFDGDGTNVFDVPVTNTAPGAASRKIPIFDRTAGTQHFIMVSDT